MAVRMLQPGAKVADAAFPNANFPAQLAAEGYEAFCGYLSSPTSNGKNWTAQRLAWFVDFGCGMFCEQYETIVLTGYSAANLALGRQCQAMADSFGVPDDAPMWFAVDTSPFGHFSEIAASFQAYKDTNRRPLGAYAGSQCIDFLMDEGLIEYGHVPSAVSWSGTSAPADGVTVFTYNGGKNRYYLTPNAHMRQHNSIEFAGSRIDPNDVLRPTPFWFQGEVVPPIEPEEDDMTLTNEDKAWIQQTVFNVCLGLWREPEMHNLMASGANDALRLQQLVNSLVTPTAAAPDPNGVPMDVQWTTIYTWQVVKDITNQVSALDAKLDRVLEAIAALDQTTDAAHRFDGTIDLNARTVHMEAS
jgi:hypothetical protein